MCNGGKGAGCGMRGMRDAGMRGMRGMRDAGMHANAWELKLAYTCCCSKHAANAKTTTLHHHMAEHYQHTSSHLCSQISIQSSPNDRIHLDMHPLSRDYTASPNLAQPSRFRAPALLSTVSDNSHDSLTSQSQSSSGSNYDVGPGFLTMDSESGPASCSQQQFVSFLLYLGSVTTEQI